MQPGGTLVVDAARRLINAGRHDAGLSLILALQASIMFVVGPLAATGHASVQLVDALRLSLAAAAVLLVARGWLAPVLIVMSFGLSFTLGDAMKLRPMAEAAAYLRLALTAAFDLTLAIVVARVAFGPGRVSVHRILGGVILYLSIALLFANLYRALAMALRPSFSGLPADPRLAFGQMLYFSLGTLTTGGTGEVLALHPFARSLANLEAVIGQLFPATLMARLVSLHMAGDPAEPAPGAARTPPDEADDGD